MRLKKDYLFLLALLAFLLCLSGNLHAQVWSGILPSGTAVDWSTAGIPGGIPSGSWTQSGSTLTPSGGDDTTQIQNALNACGTNHYVLLGAGTFTVNGVLNLTSNCEMRGNGANSTILSIHSSSGGAAINMGGFSINPSNDVFITGGTTAGSTSITVSSASGISVGSFLQITELNDSFVSDVGGAGGGTCTFCDLYGGTRLLGQIVQVTGVSGTTLTISPGLFRAMPLTPLATPFTMALQYSGVENLQVYANNTGAGASFHMQQCAYCWLSGVETNYTDGDHVDVDWSYHDMIVNSYFSNAFLHTPGTYDSDVDVRSKSTGVLVQNNIIERGHVSIMTEWGSAGNVFAYNYAIGNFDAGSPNFAISNFSVHGAHPEFNLLEGNIFAQGTTADMTWGSSSDNTLFRNWDQGAQKACNPTSGRSTVACTPLGANGSANGWWEIQATRAVVLDAKSTSYNIVGEIVGSQNMLALTHYDDGVTILPHVPQVVAVCGPSPCGPGSRSYDDGVYELSFGFDGSADAGGDPLDSVNPYTTAFIHGVYSSTNNAVTWSGSVTHSLPPSFYLSSQPSWWPSSIPWPAIGPDITGGVANGFGHAYKNPAEVCYETVMGGTDGSGGPLTFNANSCYGQQQASAQSAPPAPPTNLTLIAN